jgi:hypothetical protein
VGRKIPVGDGHAGQCGTLLPGRRPADAAALVEGFIHGVFKARDELALLLEEGRMRQGHQARPALPINAEGHPVAGEAAGQIIDDGEAKVFEALLLGGHAQHVKGRPGPFETADVVLPLTTQEQAFEPADAPVQLAHGALQGLVGALVHVENNRPVQTPVDIHRVGHHHHRTGLPAQDQAAPLAQALLRAGGQVSDVGFGRRPHRRRHKGAATLLQQQQGSPHFADLHALQGQPAAAEVGGVVGTDKGAPLGVGSRSCRSGAG